MLFIGIDVGTSGAKVLVIDEEGTVRGSAATTYELTVSGPGIAEHDPEVYWRAVRELVPRALADAGASPADVGGLATSALSPVCILVDAEGRPLANSQIWMDRRGTCEADWIRERVGEDRVFDVSGNVIDPFYGLVKLVWELFRRPELCGRAAHVLDASGFITRRLCGRAAMDWTNACLYGIAFDMRRLAWDEGILEELEVRRELLPELVAPGAILGRTTPAAAEACGLVPGIPVVAGLVDGSSVCVGTGMTDPGDSVIFLGSSACLFTVQRGAAFARGPINIVHALQPSPAPASADERLYTGVGAMVGGGTMLKFVRDRFGESEMRRAAAEGADAYDLLTAKAAGVAPGSDGLVLLPYLMGERTPIWDPHASGVAFGLRLEHTRAHLVRAALESVAYGLRHNLDALREAGLAPTEPVRIAEGGARSALWRQIVADVLGVRIRYAGHSGGAPYGAALLAGHAAGHIGGDVFARVRETDGDICAPDPAAREVYEKGYRTYRALYPALRPLFRDAE